MNFSSDNSSPVSPQIIEALVKANTDFQSSYSNDEYTNKLRNKVAEIFEHEVSIYFTSTGTAANSLALSAMCPSYGIVYCGNESHVFTDEVGIFSGAKLSPIPTQFGKMVHYQIESAIARAIGLRPHEGKPSVITVTQATEWGAVYSLGELEAIKNLAQKYNLYLHMDGARFANALAYGQQMYHTTNPNQYGCTPAQMTWKSGVDILSFGATKNGAMLAEMVIVFNPKLADEFDYLVKKYGQLLSKARYIAAQFLAYFENDLWLKNAAHANAMAQELARVFNDANVDIYGTPQSNELFVALKEPLVFQLRENGVVFYDWIDQRYRFVTSWCTQPKDIEDVEQLMKSLVQPKNDTGIDLKTS